MGLWGLNQPVLGVAHFRGWVDIALLIAQLLALTEFGSGDAFRDLHPHAARLDAPLLGASDSAAAEPWNRSSRAPNSVLAAAAALQGIADPKD